MLSWTDVALTVQAPQGPLRILQDIHGQASAGRLLAIMGSSGSGKTSLLDVLCSRIMDGETAGKILYNNKPIDVNHRFAYVPQHDHLLNTATIRETLVTASLLRSPNISPEELDREVDAVLGYMNLKHREHFMIGGGDVRGISGGEKRRVSIAQEIVCSTASVLFLDEPTTGLDSNTSENVMRCLLDIAKRRNIIVIATIHQPNSNITSLFDDLMLLSHGKCVYFGPFKEAVDFFSVAGHLCPMYYNPTDHFLTVIDKPENIDSLVAQQKKKYVGNATAAESSSTVTASSTGQNASDETVVHRKYTSSVLSQAYVLTIRAARQWLRDPAMFFAELIQYIFLALFLGGMYYQTKNTLDEGVFNRISSLFFIISVLVFTPPFTVLTSFSLEKPLFKKERRDRMYRASSWLIAKSVVAYPIEAVFCLVFSSISYFMVGFQLSAEKFFIFFGILLLFQLNAESMGLLFAVLCDSPVYAIVYISLILIVMLSLAGFLTYSMPIYYQWIMDSNLFHFALSALVTNEFDGLYLDAGNGVTVHAIDALPPLMKPKRTIGENAAILIGMLAIQRILILLILVLQNKPNGMRWIAKKFGIDLRPSNAYSAVSTQKPDADAPLEVEMA